MALGILCQQFPRSIQMGVFPNAGKNIQHFASVWLRVLRAIGSEERQTICAREINQFAIDLLLPTNEMPLDFNKDIFASTDIDQKPRNLGERMHPACCVWHPGKHFFRSTGYRTMPAGSGRSPEVLPNPPRIAGARPNILRTALSRCANAPGLVARTSFCNPCDPSPGQAKCRRLPSTIRSR